MKRDEIILRNGGEWLHFSEPHRVISTDKIWNVGETLLEIERLVNENQWHAAGFVSYEAAPAFDNALHVVETDGFPLLWFGLYDPPRTVQLPAPAKDFTELKWNPTTERGVYNAAIEKVKDHIASGKTYQVNYTMRLQADFSEDTWDFFLFMAQTQNKYAAYIDTGRHVICSASPELFFDLDGETLTGRPMKGTVKRGRTTQEDKELADWLHHSIKNRAENVMIVDMIRNDFGRIAEIGSVHVPELFTVEKYPTLLQMTSTVKAKTKASLAELFAALFPCASITGAPKVSTMNIISELETTPRKIYTGSIGHIAPNRKARFNVAIRTALIDREQNKAEYGVGGGIVWDSTSADEYSEALLKAQVLTQRPQSFSLLETLLWTPEEGYFLLEKHLARVADSAEFFGFEFSTNKLETHLAQIASGFTSPQRIRVLVNRSGEISVEAKDFHPQKRAFKAQLAEKPMDSHNIFLFHKTTKREMYPSPVLDDILLYNEKDELTEFTIGNLVVEMDGQLFTPPISCGLLAGTFRAHLLETGKISERIILKSELPECTKVFLVNSVRGWVGVEME
ncbi:MAG: aminodeoxychorismate synthase component I [Anaerolineales bacterium]|nr:aminodeoxychorismate synthase component I [Anaerolineales bacterium]